MSEPRARAPKFPLSLGQLTPTLKTYVQHGGVRSATDAQPAASATSTTAPHRPVLRPQHPLAHAHAPQAPQGRPAGLGMDSDDVRKRMLSRLRTAGVRHPGVLDAMARVQRHRFVDAALVTQAYEDTSLPIGHGQTISKPSVVARMIELLFAGEVANGSGSLGRVLEIGTGCGYQAALLALLGRQVYSIERLQALHERARLCIDRTATPNLRLIYGDGMLGHPPNAPYDSIIAAAGGDALPAAWLEQLAIGGRLVSPLRQAGTQRQVLMVVDRTERGYVHVAHEAVHFVPLKSGTGG